MNDEQIKWLPLHATLFFEDTTEALLFIKIKVRENAT
jgi:hypothetical protein